MKRFGLAVISMALVFALATGVEAQVKTGGKNESARAITISGNLDFTFVHRSEAVNEVLDNEYQRARATATTNLGKVEDDNFLQLYFKLRFDVELAEKVGAVLELENRILQSDLTVATTTTNGVDQEGVSGGAGSNANRGLIGAQNDFNVFLGQAYIEVKEFLWQQLSFKLGIQDHRYDLRGNGNAFFMDIREAELAYATPTLEAFAGNIYYGHEIPGGVTAAGAGTGPANTHGNFNGGLFRDQNREAGGLKFTYNLDDNLFVDLFWFQTFESSAGGNLGSAVPGIAEGDDRYDEYTIGLNIDYNIDEKSLFNFIYAGIYGDDGHVNVHTVGFGLDYYLTPEFEAYIEFYGQWGDSGHVSSEGTNVAHNDQEVDHEAYAGIVGLKYTFDHEIKPWFDLSFTYVSGDDGDISTNGNTGPDTNHDFISYEDNDATMILEENHFGLDVDSNYWKIQGEMGITVSLDRQDDFHISTLLAWAEVAHGPTRRGINHGANGLELDDDEEDELGLEWNVKMTWNYTESLDFSIGFAWLFTDEDDYWHNQDSGRTASAGGPAIGDKDGFAVTEGEELWLLTVDTKLRF